MLKYQFHVNHFSTIKLTGNTHKNCLERKMVLTTTDSLPKIGWIFKLIGIFITFVNSENILCLTPPLAGRGSHLALMTSLCNALVQGDRNATLLIQGPGTPAPSNLTVIRHNSAYSEENIEAYAKEFTRKSLNGDFGLFDLLCFVKRLSSDCDLWMADDAMFQQLKKTNFTIAIVDHFYFCGMIYAHRLGIPIIVLDTASYFSVLDSGVPIPLSYVPMYNSELTDHMTFWERTINLVAYIGSQFVLQLFRNPFLEIASKYNVTDNKQGNNFFSDAELWLLNSDFTLEFPRPILPNMLYVGGAIAKDAEPLDEVPQMSLYYFNN